MLFWQNDAALRKHDRLSLPSRNDHFGLKVLWCLLWWWRWPPFSSRSAPEWTSKSVNRKKTQSLWFQNHKHTQNTPGWLILGHFNKGEKKTNKQQLTTKSLPRQSTSAGTPLWGLHVFLGYKTSLNGEKNKQTQKHHSPAQFNVKKSLWC